MKVYQAVVFHLQYHRANSKENTVNKVILRHTDFSTTQRYLGKVNDTEAIRWIETLYG